MATEQTYSPEAVLFDITSRTRDLEGKYNLLRDRVLIINTNMVDEYKKLTMEMKLMNGEIKNVKEELFKIKESMRHLLKEFDLFARKEDVAYLEKYINLWNPLKFVTEADVLKLLEEHTIKKGGTEHHEGKTKKR